MTNTVDNYLPTFSRSAFDVRGGRNVKDGYARAWGLQFGNLREAIRKDRLYIEATTLTRGRTVVTEDHRMNIFLILKFFLDKIPFGHIVEFGAYKGGNAIFMAHVVNKLYPGMRVFALDTFEGMPEADSTIDAHRLGDFKDVDLTETKRFALDNKLNNLEFVQGLFQHTAPALLSKIDRVSLAHIDCDIYSAVAYSYEVVRPHMVAGGYYVFDDATYASCLGATEAVEALLVRRDGLHSEQIVPQFVFRAPFA
jgi:hypothetical protein